MTRPYLYVMDPLDRVNPNADTTFAFLLESQARGVENHVCEITDLWSEGRRGFARTRKTTVRRPTDDDASQCSFGAHETRAFDDFSVIWMRKDPPVDEIFLLSTMLLDRHDPKKTLLMNDPAGLRIANEKLWGLFADDLGPDTVVSSRTDVLVNTIEKWGKGVVKPIGLAGGTGVMVFESGDKNLRAAVDLLTLEGRRPAVAQAYIPEVREGDKRVILLGGDAVGAVLRVPQQNDHRANMHVGGSAVKTDVTDRDREIAARLKPELLKLGIHFAGIDVIGGRLTEVNVTSPTGVQEIDRLDGRTGKDSLPVMVMDYTEALLKERGIS